MSKENTRDLTDSEKLNLIIAELADMRAWRTSVDDWRAKVGAFIDDRSRDTRPMLNKIHREIAETRTDISEIKDRLRRVERKFDLVASDAPDLRAALRDVENRISILERPPS